MYSTTRQRRCESQLPWKAKAHQQKIKSWLSFSDGSSKTPTDFTMLRCTNKSTGEPPVSTHNVHAVVLSILKSPILVCLIKESCMCNCIFKLWWPTLNCFQFTTVYSKVYSKTVFSDYKTKTTKLQSQKTSYQRQLELNCGKSNVLISRGRRKPAQTSQHLTSVTLCVILSSKALTCSASLHYNNGKIGLKPAQHSVPFKCCSDFYEIC